MVDLAALLVAARRLAPPGVAVAAGDPTAATAATAQLWGAEVLVKAIPKRQTEFSAGRATARSAMALLGVAPAAIAHGPDRAPVWPDGIHGSITHSDTACLAAVTHAPRLIGIDLEPSTPLDASLQNVILNPIERAAIAHSSDPALAGKLIFSAKEAAYKAQYARSRTLLDFDALEITLEHGSFTARFIQAVPGFPKGAILYGRFCQSQGHFLTLVVT